MGCWRLMYKDKVQGVFIHHSFFEIEDLSLPQKLIYAKVCDLDNEKGCYASNRYFGQLFKISQRQVSTHINNLIKKGYITSKFVYKSGTKEIDYRVLNTTSMGMEELQHKGYGRTIPISKDITNNNIKEREEKFTNQICSLGLKYTPMLEPRIIDEFTNHWTEPNKSNTKMRFESEKFFDQKRRMDTWIARDAKWNKKKAEKKKITQFSLDSTGFPMGYCKKCGDHRSYDKFEILNGDSRCCGVEILPQRSIG
jgi:hypothetical protein